MSLSGIRTSLRPSAVKRHSPLTMSAMAFCKKGRWIPARSNEATLILSLEMTNTARSMMRRCVNSSPVPPCAAVASATPGGTLAAHSLVPLAGMLHGPAVAAGLEVSRRNTFQDLPCPTSPLRVASTCRSLPPVPSVAWPGPSSQLHGGRTPGSLGFYRLGEWFFRW